MYIPEIYGGDAAATFALMRAHPFATLTVQGDGGMRSAHLPFVTRRSEQGAITLHGHLARDNHVTQLLFEREVLVHFHGPHAYIPPDFYSHTGHFPTWIFAVVHAYGEARPMDREALSVQLQDLVAQQEGERWTISRMPEALTRHLQEMILGFTIEVGRIESCFRLNQNKPEVDVRAIAANLERTACGHHTELAALVREHFALADQALIARHKEKYLAPAG